MYHKDYPCSEHRHSHSDSHYHTTLDPIYPIITYTTSQSATKYANRLCRRSSTRERHSSGPSHNQHDTIPTIIISSCGSSCSKIQRQAGTKSPVRGHQPAQVERRAASHGSCLRQVRGCRNAGARKGSEGQETGELERREETSRAQKSLEE